MATYVIRYLKVPEIERCIFEYVITGALRATLLHLLQNYEDLFEGTEVDERTLNLFTKKALDDLNKCGKRIGQATFPGELVALWRFYHHGLNTAGFQEPQTRLWRFLNRRKGDVEMLKLTQRITAKQRYTLMNPEPLSLDVFCLSLESLIVLFRDIIGSKLNSVYCENCKNCKTCKHLLDSVYKIVELRRRILHTGHATTEEERIEKNSLMKDIFELSSSLRVKFFRHAIGQLTLEAQFWNSHVISSLHFTCVIDENESTEDRERRGIPIHSKRKTSVVHNVLPGI